MTRRRRSGELVIGSVCTGYGGLDLGTIAAFSGGRIAWCADPDPHIRTVLSVRMPGVPNLGDIRDIDWRQVEPVQVLTAGFPCQDISSAGRGAGIQEGNRSGLWYAVMDAVRHLRPTLVIVENVAALRWRTGGLAVVLGELATAGYDTLWRSLRASDIGAPHRRERVFLLAWRTGTETAARRLAARAHPDGRRLTLVGHPNRPALDPADPAWGCHVDRRDADAVLAEPEWVDRRPHPHLPCPAAPANPGRREPKRRGRPGPVDEPQSTTQAKGDPQRDPATDRGRLAAEPAGGTQPHEPDRDTPVPVRTRTRTSSPDPDRDPTRGVGHRDPVEGVDWGPYEPAIRRWEHLLGRPAPHPTEPGRQGRSRLAPDFVEWLMGLAVGWLTDAGLPRTAQLRGLGNGVVPQQAAAAVSLLLSDLVELTANRVGEAA